MFKFSIIDYSTDPNGVETYVDEPVGLDGVVLKMKREDKVGWGGFFEFMDGDIDELRFYGVSNLILKNAYDNFGVDAKVDFKIQTRCDIQDNYIELYTGRFAFDTASFICGVECYTTITLHANDCLMSFKNRYDQKVNLDTLDIQDTYCIHQTQTTNGAFQSPNGIALLGVFDCIKVGDTITISGTTSNNSTFTVASVEINDSGYTILQVVESVTNEFAYSLTVEGILSYFKLPKYDGLGVNVLFPNKDITIYGEAKGYSGMKFNFFQGDGEYHGCFTGVPNNANFNVVSNFEMTRTFDDFNAVNNTTKNIQCSTIFAPDVILEPIFEFNINRELKCSAESVFTIKVNGLFKDTYQAEAVPGNFFIYVTKGDTDYQHSTVLKSYNFSYTKGEFATRTQAVSFEEIDIPITLKDGDKIWLFCGLVSHYGNGALSGIGNMSFELTEDIFFSVNAISSCTPTVIKSYMVNESLSRISEFYTNYCLRVYSEYFGRKNSQPYNTLADGCGANEILTNGLLLRGNDEKLVVSFKELFEGLKGIHNIGMGIENDPNRAGYKMLRVEPIEHFYSSDVIMVCDNPTELKRKINNRFITKINVGYEKWETEETNGLYDIFAKREYRTAISSSSGEYTAISKLMASDYAIEVTRRKFGATTKDWRYDNDTFICCVEGSIRVMCARFVEGDNIINIQNTSTQIFKIGQTIKVTGSAHNDGTYTITGMDMFVDMYYLYVDKPLTLERCVDIIIEGVSEPLYQLEKYVGTYDNIPNPDTAYNLRITPARNLMRHYKNIAPSLARSSDQSIKFSHGTGNYNAAANIYGSGCTIEGDIKLSESQTIEPSAFNSIIDSYALFYNESIEFSYPISFYQYLNIINNKYGLIGVSCNDVIEYGWITELEYDMKFGVANFTLKLKKQN